MLEDGAKSRKKDLNTEGTTLESAILNIVELKKKKKKKTHHIKVTVKAELFPDLFFIGFYCGRLVDFQEEV